MTPGAKKVGFFAESPERIELFDLPEYRASWIATSESCGSQPQSPQCPPNVMHVRSVALVNLEL